MSRGYTENDLVFKSETINDVISQYTEYLSGDPPPGFRNEITRLFTRAEKEKRKAHSSGLDLDAWYDRDRKEYVIVRQGVYSPQNLLYNLFDILVEHPRGEPEVLRRSTEEVIDRYIGEIEGREGLSFLGQRENLKQLCGEMIETMNILDEQDFPDAELEKVSDQIDRTYYEPIGMILQGILIDIEKPPGV